MRQTYGLSNTVVCDWNHKFAVLEALCFQSGPADLCFQSVIKYYTTVKYEVIDLAGNIFIRSTFGKLMLPEVAYKIANTARSHFVFPTSL
jgi:hypothetical protein